MHLHPPQQILPAQHPTTDQKLHQAAGPNQARGVCQSGESNCAGMGELLSPHQCQRRFSALAAIHQHSLSPVSELSQYRPRLRVEEIPECGSVYPGHHLHRERSHQVRVKVCACCGTKTVGPPDSGKLNVRWDGKGMVTGHADASEALQKGKPAETDRRHLKSLSHSFTLDTILGFQHQAEADRFLANLRERLGKFGFELHPDKTCWIEFGRFAEQNRERRGEGKPETLTSRASRTSAGRMG